MGKVCKVSKVSKGLDKYILVVKNFIVVEFKFKVH